MIKFKKRWKGVINIKEMKKTLNAHIKASENAGSFSGYLSTYDLDRDNDTFIKGCWDDSIKRLESTKGVARVPLLYQHKPDQIIGYADLTIDEKGLKADGTLYIDENIQAKTIYKALKDKSLNEMSVGFNATEYETYENENGYGYKFIKSEPTEASIVFSPANTQAVISEVKELTATDTQKIINSTEFENQVIKILVQNGLLNELPTTNEEPMTVENKNAKKINEILKNIKGETKWTYLKQKQKMN